MSEALFLNINTYNLVWDSSVSIEATLDAGVQLLTRSDWF